MNTQIFCLRWAFFVVEELTSLKTVKTAKNRKIVEFFPKIRHFFEKKDPKFFSPAVGFFRKIGRSNSMVVKIMYGSV